MSVTPSWADAWPSLSIAARRPWLARLRSTSVASQGNCLLEPAGSRAPDSSRLDRPGPRHALLFALDRPAKHYGYDAILIRSNRLAILTTSQPYGPASTDSTNRRKDDRPPGRQA